MSKRRLAGPVPRLGRVAIIAQLLAAVAFVVVLLGAEGVRLPFTGGGDWTIRAAFADAGGIHTGERTPVLVAGVPSGSVTAVRVRNGLAIVTMRLDGTARGAIRRDATATIEPRSALQDLTIDISPGSPAIDAAGPGMQIGAARTRPTTTLDRVTAMLDSDTRTQLSVLVGQLAAGTRGRGGQLNQLVAQLHRLLDPATQVADALSGRRQLLAELVDSVSRIGAAVQHRDVALAASLHAGARTLSVTARREAQIQDSVEALPATTASVDAALRSMHSLATPLVPTLGGLTRTGDALPAALHAVRAVTPTAGALLRAADRFASGGGGSLHAAAGLLGALPAVARELTPAIQRFEPIVSAVNARRQGIGQLGERFSGVLSTDDANGPVLRGLGSFEPFNPADFGYPGASGAKKTALETQAAQALTLTCLHGNPVACLVRYLVPGLPNSVR